MNLNPKADAKTTEIKTLQLRRQSLRNLSATDLSQVVGGTGTTTKPSKCL